MTKLDDDEEVAFHAHLSYGEEQSIAVHARRPPERIASDDIDARRPPEHIASVDDEATTTPVNRAARADREIAQFVSLLDIEHATREMDISRTPTTSRRFA